MKFKKIAGALACASLALAGCGGSGGGSGTGNGSPTTNDAKGVTALNGMLADQATITEANLSQANAAFKAALNSSPSDRTANGGYAITFVALRAQRLINLLNLPTGRTGLLGLLNGRLTSGRLGFLNTLLPNVSASDFQMVDASGRLQLFQLFNASGNQSFTTSPTYAQIYAALTDASATLAIIDKILSVESVLPSDSNPLVLTNPANPQKTIKVGTVEMRSLHSSVQSLEAVLDLMLAYNFGYDRRTYPAGDAFSVTFAANLNASPIPAAAYLPGGTFGTLYRDGKARMGGVPQFLLNSIRTTFSALDAYQSRTGTGWAIDPGTVSAGQIAEYELGANIVIAYLTHDQRIAVNGSTVSLQLPEWFANPPASLVPLLPNIHYSGTQESATASINDQSDFPDRTFGGLFSDVVPIGGNPIATTTVSPDTSLGAVLKALAISAG